MSSEDKETPGVAAPREAETMARIIANTEQSRTTSNRQQPEHSNRESQRLAHAQQLRSQAAELRRRAAEHRVQSHELRAQAARLRCRADKHRRRAAELRRQADELRAQKPQPDA